MEKTSSIADSYNAMAEAYASDIERNPYNAFYERPATIDLLPPLTGRDVLDVGSGPGVLAAHLADAGARVTGIDLSQRMVEIANAKEIPNARFIVADVAEQLPFPDDSFDVVVASLVLHYLRDWTPALREIHRLIRPEGSLVGSVHHPACDLELSPSQNYFATELVHYRWVIDGSAYEVELWRRPLRAILAAFRDAGWAVDVLEEPKPVPECREHDEAAWRSLTSEPTFLLFRLQPE